MRNQYTPNDFEIKGDLCTINIYNNKSEYVGFTTIDSNCISRCISYKWCFILCNGKLYVINSRNRILLHHLILNIPNTKDKIDHINGNTLDNRKGNLRICSHQQNLANTGKSKNNTSGYKGVCWDKQHNKWRSSITNNRVLINLGLFINPVEAAKVYDAKARELHGEFAYQNFPKPKLKRRNQIETIRT